MFSSSKSAALSAFFLSLSSISQAATFDSKSNVALYWGQNAFGQGSGPNAQRMLNYYCSNTSADIITISFITKMTSGGGDQPVLNLANQQAGCSPFPGSNLLSCPLVERDIKTCQQTYNKTILLSIGGATYNEGGFPNATEAQRWADKMWFTFGPKVYSSGVQRPFGSAVVDGFDFDFETQMNNIKPFASRLRLWINSYRDKKMYLTASPQCPYPDVADDSMLNGGVAFDGVFVQYYNNYCGSQSFNPNTTTQTDFNFARWDQWAKQGSANKNVKVFLGVPGGPGNGGPLDGYLPIPRLAPVIQYVKNFTSFGGVSIWDASVGVANQGFVQGVKNRVR